MIETQTLRKLMPTFFGASARLKGLRRLAGVLRRALMFSAADERVALKRVFCVSIEDAGLSVAYGTRFLSRVRIRAAKSYPVKERGFPQPKDVASSAELAVRELGASRAEVALSIPKAWTVIKTATLPSAVRENLPDVVAYELDRLTPFTSREALYDFRVLGESQGKIAVVVAAAKADLVNRYIEALGGRGITVSRVSVSLSGIGALWGHKGKGAPIFLELRDDRYEGAFYHGGILAGAFSGVFGTDGEGQQLEAIAEDIAPLAAAAKRQGASPHIIALLKGGPPAQRDLLKKRTGLPVTLLNETDPGICIPGRQTEGAADGTPYAAVGGAVESLQPEAKGMNLLTRGRSRMSKTPMALTAVLALCLLAVWAAYVIAPLNVEEKRLAEIERQIKLKKSSMKGVESLQKEIGQWEDELSAIDEFKNGRPMSAAIVKELTALLPKTVWLTRLRATATTVEIEGYAGSATELLPRLESSKYFRKAEFASPTFRDMRMNADRFNIKMEIKGDAEE